MFRSSDNHSVIRTVYEGAMAMLAGQQAVDVIANNIANSATPAFKPDRFYVELDKATGKTQNRQYIDFTDSSLHRTGSSLDIALLGNNFLAVQREDGFIGYSKGGSLVVGSDGFLRTATGEKILGQKGAITGLVSGEVTITPAGEVQQGGATLDTLRVESFSDLRSAERIGPGLFSGAAQASVEFQVQAGYLEDSGSNPVSEAVNLITAFRAYETASRVLTTTDDLFNRAIQALRA